MDYARHIEQLGVQYQALRAAAVKAGPEARIPTCPDWSIAELVAHLGRVYAWVPGLVEAQAPPEMPEPPSSWDELLPWTDTKADGLMRAFADTDPGTPAWVFAHNATVSFWARRMAHETAIHRLDAEHSVSASLAPLPGLIFDSEFAADGIDELLAVMVPVPHPAKNELTAAGTLLFHAADAGQAWQLTLVPGEAPTCSPATGSATEVDATMAGTADAVFRAVWGRPDNAIRTGETDLFASVPTP